MAEHEHAHEHDEPEETPGYQPPAPKSMEEILKTDQEDESLRKYKEALLGTSNPVAVEVCK
jgi:Rho GDP-dissociation inhibitor